MPSFAKLVAGAVRPISAALRPLRARFNAYWDVDHRSVNFYTDSEWEAISEKRKEEWDARMKNDFFSHVRTSVVPRVKIDLLSDKPVVLLDSPSRTQGDLANKYAPSPERFLTRPTIVHFCIALVQQPGCIPHARWWVNASLSRPHSYRSSVIFDVLPAD